LLGDAVGKLYVDAYFAADAKAKATALVGDIVKAFGKRIDGLKWMTAATKAKAREKVGTLKVFVGYPDTWRAYDFKVSADDLYGNVMRGRRFEYQRAVARLSQKPDPAEWWMVPQVVNAVNLPLQNAMNFPAAILQPPFFDPHADAALNYGAIGSVMGHEISHSFDNTGAEFDAQGKLSNWWTEDDLAHFKAASTRLVKQYDAYRPFDDLSVNGEQTLGENIADVAGLAAAYDAYKASLRGKPAPVIDGLSGDQRFFIAFAQGWKQKIREEALRSRIISDGHAPDQYRGNSVRNIDAWYTAFKVKKGHRLFLPEVERVRVW
jgi:putative endopeptidase